MGITDSNSKQVGEQKYKLIRRYTSDCYGDLTVIQNKQTQQLYALKEMIVQNEYVMQMCQRRKALRHKNLANLEEYWFEGESSICSTIRKMEIVFEYFPMTLEEQLSRRVEEGQGFSDMEIVTILGDAVECLECMSANGFLHLLGGMKMVLYNSASRSIKIMDNQQAIMHSPSSSKQLNIVGILNNKKVYPLHPQNQPKDVCDVCLSGQKVAHQNLFVLGLICIGLCWAKEPFQLGVFGKNGYNLEKIEKRVNQIKNKFPNVHRILVTYMSSKSAASQSAYSNILSEIYSLRRSFSKENERNQRIIDIQPIQKIGGEKKMKKLSYLREMRLSNNDIPNQY